MPKIEKTKGIVIRCRDLTETSQIVWFYTKDFGKIKIVAKGSRAPKKKSLKSKLDLFGLNEIVFYYNHKSELHTLSENELEDSFTGIRSDIGKIAIASYMIEFLDNVVGLEDPSQKIYFLTVNMLKWLSRTDKLWFLKLIFEIKLLQYTGDFKMPEDISKGAGAIIKRILHSRDIDSLKKLKISKMQFEELKNAMGLTIDFSLGKRLKSLDFLEEVCSVKKG